MTEIMDIPTQIKILEGELKKDENRECADCTVIQPRWASTTFGTFVCIKCSGKTNTLIGIGFHRSLGTHITKVKSVNLDAWPVKLV